MSCIFPRAWIIPSGELSKAFVKKAFVVLRPGYTLTPELTSELAAAGLAGESLIVYTILNRTHAGSALNHLGGRGCKQWFLECLTYRFAH